MKTIAKIKWQKRLYGEGEWGLVNNQIMFFIEPSGKRKVKYILQSYPFDNGVFTRANNSKKLYSGPDLIKAKRIAQKSLEKYTKMFLEKNNSPKVDNGTLVLLTIYHTQYNMQDGISIEPIDKLIEMAAGFEKQYPDMNGKWEEADEDWENAVIKYYNKHKPTNWWNIIN